MENIKITGTFNRIPHHLGGHLIPRMTDRILDRIPRDSELPDEFVLGYKQDRDIEYVVRTVFDAAKHLAEETLLRDNQHLDSNPKVGEVETTDSEDDRNFEHNSRTILTAGEGEFPKFLYQHENAKYTPFDGSDYERNADFLLVTRPDGRLRIHLDEHMLKPNDTSLHVKLVIDEGSEGVFQFAYEENNDLPQYHRNNVSSRYYENFDWRTWPEIESWARPA